MLYSPSLVKLQIYFINEKPAAVKDLMRLVKYWNKTTVAVETSRPALPTSYQFELITIYAWERAGSPQTFDRLQGFKDVLTIIANEIDYIRYFWTINYNSSIGESGIKIAEKKCHKRLVVGFKTLFRTVINWNDEYLTLCFILFDNWCKVGHTIKDAGP